MVVQGDFKVELVDAITNKPFLEHYHNGQTYVEVEPGAEYYLRYQRVGVEIKEPRVCMFYVDGNSLGWAADYVGVPERDHYPTLIGARRRVQRKGRVESEEVSLKFAKPKRDENSASEQTVMGTVEFQLYRDGGSYDDWTTESDDDDTWFAASEEMTLSSAVPVKAKPLRSVKGSHSKSIPIAPGRCYGAHVETIALYYCTVAGLIHLGIFPPPENTKQGETKRQSEQDKKPASLKPLLVPVQRIEYQPRLNGRYFSNSDAKFSDYFDLSFLPSDSEDEAVSKPGTNQTERPEARLGLDPAPSNEDGNLEPIQPAQQEANRRLHAQPNIVSEEQAHKNHVLRIKQDECGSKLHIIC